MRKAPFFLLILAACAPGPEIPASLSSRWDAEFEAASVETGVPAIVLAATSRVLTDFQDVHGGDELGVRTFGPLAFTEENGSITDAAKSISDRADQLQIDRTDLFAWSEVIADYARIDHPEARREFIDRQWFPLLTDRSPLRRIEQLLSPDDPNAIWRASPNFQSRDGAVPSFVIIHTCEGNYSGCWSWQVNPASEVSAHFTVSNDGSEISQLVQESDRAWHVGATYDCANNQNFRCDLNGKSTNANSIGIEHGGYASQTSFPEGQLATSAKLVCRITTRWNIPRDRLHILSHAQLQPANRTDPGANWPWTEFIARVRSECGDDQVVVDAGLPPVVEEEDAGVPEVIDAGLPVEVIVDAGSALPVDAGQPEPTQIDGVSGGCSISVTPWVLLSALLWRRRTSRSAG